MTEKKESKPAAKKTGENSAIVEALNKLVENTSIIAASLQNLPAQPAATAPPVEEEWATNLCEADSVSEDYEGPYAEMTFTKTSKMRYYRVPQECLEAEDVETVTADGEQWYLIPLVNKSKQQALKVAVIADKLQWRSPRELPFGFQKGTVMIDVMKCRDVLIKAVDVPQIVAAKILAAQQEFEARNSETSVLGKVEKRKDEADEDTSWMSG